MRSPGSLVACGPGVERVQEEVAERFPDARVALLSSDLIPGLTEMREMIRSIEAREFDIIIGTQIVAKGHNFPGLAIVGVVDGDLGLAHGADPRSAERTFQLLHQVTGRAGRTSFVGRGFVQTYSPDHPGDDSHRRRRSRRVPELRGANAPSGTAPALRPPGGHHRLLARQSADRTASPATSRAARPQAK